MKIRKLKFTTLAIPVIVVVLGCVVPLIVTAESVTPAAKDQAKETSADSSAEVDEQALTILRKATDYLTSLNQFHLKGTAVEDVVQESGQKLQFGSAIEVTVQRPNRLFASRIDDDGNVRQFWYDGKTATMYDEKENVYGKISIPGTIDEMLDYLETVIETPRPLADLFYNDLSYLADTAVSGVYVDESYLGSISCDHLAFRGESVDWQIWVDRGEKPFIRKIVITYKELASGPQFAAHLVQWNTHPELSDSLFQFSPPERARAIRVVVPQKGDEEEGGAKR